MTSPAFILASGSPRRKALLSQLGLAFLIEKPNVDESTRTSESPEDYVTRLALTKVKEIARRAGHQDKVILAADTTVVLDGNILGKPDSKQHGIETLLSLSDTTHQVLTGVSVTGSKGTETFFVASEVTFRPLFESEAEAYWETGEPADKAGAYGLQGIGAMFVSTIHGSYSNVIGLPLVETVTALRNQGVKCLGVGAEEKDFKLVRDSQHG
jgi:septum formation protein